MWTLLSPLWSNSRANVASGAATEVLVILMHKVSEYVLRDPYTTRTKSATKTDDDIPSIMMPAAVKSSGIQNLGWTHLSPLRGHRGLGDLDAQSLGVCA